MAGRENLENYCTQQAYGGWGGVIETIGTAVTFAVTLNVWIPEQGKPGHFRRTVSALHDTLTVT